MGPDCEPLARLGEDASYTLWRVRERRSGGALLLKTPRVEPAPPEDIATLRCEAALAAGLEALADLKPRWLDAGAGALLCDDPGGSLLSTRIDEPMPIASVLAIAVQLSAALDELHRRGIVHRSVRPDAILVDAPGTRAWLIDLGEAVRKPERAPTGS